MLPSAGRFVDPAQRSEDCWVVVSKTTAEDVIWRKQ
jgi:hypothetical protein